MRRIITLVIVLVSIPTLASAAFVDGNKLLEMCEKGPEMAMSYIAGVTDQGQHMLAMAKAIGIKHPEREDTADYLAGASTMGVCLPEEAKGSQYMDLTCKWLKENPGERHMDAASLIWMGFRTAWPCH